MLPLVWVVCTCRLFVWLSSSKPNSFPFARRYEVHFQDVHFNFRPSAPVLQGVSLHIPAGGVRPSVEEARTLAGHVSP